jgi:hypothetical protein
MTRRKLGGGLVLVLVLGVIGMSIGRTTTVAPSPRPAPRTATTTSTRTPVADPAPSRREAARTYTPQQVAAAQNIMDSVVGGLARVTVVDGDWVEVRFDYGVLPGMPRERLHEFVAAFANADAVLAHRARHIEFYDPTGERIAVVSPLSGIQLTK